MSELRPCPLCSEHLWPCNEGFEHPASDTCPLDNMWFPERLVAAWNTRDTPTLSAAMGLPEVKALVEALELAANRLHRCAVDYDTGTLRFYETCEWTDEACAALAAIKEPKT